MHLRPVLQLPEFDTGQFGGSSFLMANGDAYLGIEVSGVEVPRIRFERVRWHQFTALYNCSVEQIESAYFTLTEVCESSPLQDFLANDKAPAKAYSELHHYRIFLDETGCHEVFAQSAEYA